MPGTNKSPHSEYIPFDNTGSPLTSTEVGPAIRELTNKVITSASPGFSFGRSGNATSGTWLACETVPSNLSGRFVYIANAMIKSVFVANEEISTFNVSVFYHNGGGTGMTLVGTVSLSGVYGDAFSVSWTVPTGAYLAMQVTGGSAKNIVAGLELSGTDA